MSGDPDGFLGMKSVMVYGPSGTHNSKSQLESILRVMSATQDVVYAAKLVAKRMSRKSPYAAECVKELMAAVDKLEQAER